MITVLFSMTAKPDHEDIAHELVLRMTEASRRDDGCITYVFHRQQDDASEYVLYEQWRDREALDAHIAHMVTLMGVPPAGAVLPAELHAVVQRHKIVFYDVVA